MLAALAVLTAVSAQPAWAGAIISNDTVLLGVNDEGHLNFTDPDTNELRGLTYVPTGNDGTRAGCECEGWGAGARLGGTLFQGRANDAEGIDGVQLVDFTSTATTATSVVDVLEGAGPGSEPGAAAVGDPALRVTHEFRPSPNTPNLYVITVTLENLTSGTLSDVRYERIMDWDVEPTEFNEFVTVQRGTAADLFYSDDNGFSDNYPFTFGEDGDGPLDESTVNANYVDKGPSDHGARFTFDFGELPAGGTKEFMLFYGAAGTEDAADAAVSADSLEVVSYGQPNIDDSEDAGTQPDGPAEGKPNTFIWGFAGVGGEPVSRPRLTLTPETDRNSLGEEHTLTAELEDSSGNPMPNSPIVFSVTGANPQPNTTRTTGGDGRAQFSYTGNEAGTDRITACLDANSNGSCDEGEVSDTAEKQWDSLPPPVLGETVNALPAGGTVFVNPLGPEPNHLLQEGEQIPVGSHVDTTDGRVQIVSATQGTARAAQSGPGTQSALFAEGVFQVLQENDDPLTEARLIGGDFSICDSGSDASASVSWGRSMALAALPVAPLHRAAHRLGEPLPVAASAGLWVGVAAGVLLVGLLAAWLLRRFGRLPSGVSERPLPAAVALVALAIGTAFGASILGSGDAEEQRAERPPAEPAPLAPESPPGAPGTPEREAPRGGGGAPSPGGGAPGTPPASGTGGARAQSPGGGGGRSPGDGGGGGGQPSDGAGRSLWARTQGAGDFRTRGRYASGAVRGTRWFTQDRCLGTLFRVTDGSITVRDFGRDRDVIVQEGESYTAEAF